MSELQIIPARHGVATFVPAGQTIKIINTSGSQVVDTWAFALPRPDELKKGSPEEAAENEKKDSAEDNKASSSSAPKTPAKATPQKKGKKSNGDLPSQEDAEKSTQEMLKQGEQQSDGTATPQKNTWSSYVPSIGLKSAASKTTQNTADDASVKSNETEQQRNSRTWSSYFPSGKGFGSYIPKSATDTVSAFAKDHQRDVKKSYLEQLQDFSRTPVGAAGLAAITGSGYSSSLYAGYQAWNVAHAPDAPPMEFMSMPHTRAASMHLYPKVDDTLVSNLREPMLTLVEDSGAGIHDTLIPACDPARYKGLGVDNWQEHGSCAENLVLALKELNERAGLKGAKGVGADVTVNNVPAPLNLFMNIPWDDEGDLAFKAPKSKKDDYVRLRAERDMVVVMSACPQDIIEVNNKTPTDAHFIVEESAEQASEEKKAPIKKRAPPKKLGTPAKAQSTAGAEANGDDAKASATPAKRPAPKKATSSASSAKPSTTTAPRKKPVPKPVTAQKSKPAATPAAASEEPKANGTAAPPAEKKKPRKLASRPKAEAAS